MRSQITRKMVLAGLFVALDIVFTRILYVYAPTLPPNIVRISPSFMAQALCGWMLGPWWAMGSAAAADVLGFFLIPPPFPFFPGYTLSAALSGLLYGLLLYRHKPAVWRTASALSLVTLFISLGLGSLWSWIMVKEGWRVIFVTALPWRLGLMAAYTGVFFLLQKALERPASRWIFKDRPA